MTEPAKKFEQEAHAQRRQASRDLVDLDAPLIRNGSRQMMVRLVDISPKGFHARSSEMRFERGEIISLHLPLIGILPGRVMWGLKGCFGAQFSVPIDARHYLELMERIRRETPGDPASTAR